MSDKPKVSVAKAREIHAVTSAMVHGQSVGESMWPDGELPPGDQQVTVTLNLKGRFADWLNARGARHRDLAHTLELALAKMYQADKANSVIQEPGEAATMTREQAQNLYEA